MTWESGSYDNDYQRASPARSGTQSVFSQSFVEQGPRSVSATTTFLWPRYFFMQL